MARQALRWDHPHLAGIDFERLEREGSVRLSVPDPYAPFAEGGFPTPSGKCELLLGRARGRRGSTRSPGYTPPREGADELAGAGRGAIRSPSSRRPRTTS